MLYFEHHYKYRTICYSLEPNNYTKLWMHWNWERTETSDMTVLFIRITVHYTFNILYSYISYLSEQWNNISSFAQVYMCCHTMLLAVSLGIIDPAAETPRLKRHSCDITCSTQMTSYPKPFLFLCDVTSWALSLSFMDCGSYCSFVIVFWVWNLQ